MSGEHPRVRAERRGRICVVAVSGPLDMAASAGLTECVRAELTARPARLVIDMSGVNFVDFSGARALAAAALGPDPRVLTAHLDRAPIRPGGLPVPRITSIIVQVAPVDQ